MEHFLYYTYIRNCEDNNLGHKVTYNFRLFHLSSKLRWPFRAEYHTMCPVWPTVFKIDLMFQKVSITGFVDIPYSIERKDSLPRQVDAFVSIKISDAKGRIIFQPLNSFGKSKMMSGEISRGNITGLVAHPELKYAFNEHIDVDITVITMFCHSGILEPAVNMNINEIVCQVHKM